MQQFSHRFKLINGTRILDLGGDLFNWSLIPIAPSLTITNLIPPKSPVDGVIWVIADGRNLPFKNAAFDIVYSNSVIEHLGDLAGQLLFAQEVSRVGVRYYVQTPNRWFPIEPHLITPFIHYLSKSIQRRLLRNFTIWGLVTRPTPQLCEEFLREIRLLDMSSFRKLFPDAEIWLERVFGMTKSLIAVRN
jgi:SAM-dependent methyltransferase